ncbi:Uncharacterised protein [BD1-7 clade bacterium]|uniref:Cytochrome c domain-containing protein n=1 Tax=BD1-7 clade bacterium TaxID=2029982 RepID=A0A5S9NSZ9_9GAMM|nr:Uncharacterised protein [BD1-7 clade bacterium]CAA0109094.1 Uncharacterised protein [BD1-7 clade bacterium]
MFLRYLAVSFIVICGMQTPTLFSSNDAADYCRFYMTGLRFDGTSVPVSFGNGMLSTSDRFSCHSCHRRSGYGGSEAGNYVPPITGAHLFQQGFDDRTWLFNDLFKREQRASDWSSLRTSRNRPAYNASSLFTALTLGVASNGKTLSPLMPRYTLDQTTYEELVTCLDSLSAKHHGVSDQQVHFSTIVHEGVSPAEKRAMLDVMHGFIHQINREVSRWQQQPDNRSAYYRAGFVDTYRHWKLQVWELTGQPNSWQQQLERFYAAEPVFAVIGGIVPSTFDQVGKFCNENELPCLFPNTWLPGVIPEDRLTHTVYFSGGARREFDAMMTIASASSVDLLFVSSDYSGKLPIPIGSDLRRFAHVEQLEEHIDHIEFVSADRTRGERFKIAIFPTSLGGTTAPAMWRPILKRLLFLPIELTLPSPFEWIIEDIRKNEGGGTLAANIYMISPYASVGDQTLRYMPDKFRSRAWLSSRGIPVTHERLQLNTFYAMGLVHDAIRHLLDEFSRQYFLEVLEREAEDALNPGVYPDISLGPDQRIAVKALTVWKLPAGHEHWQPLTSVR